MKTLFFTLLFSLQLFANNCESLSKIRGIFQAGVNEEQLEAMILICKASNCDNVTPYLAAATMKKAEFAWSPFNKLKYFNTGKKMLENFIKDHPQNIEAKYIRWLTQKMAPKFLNYRDHLEQDYQYIKNNIAKSNLPTDYRNVILAHIKKVNNE